MPLIEAGNGAWAGAVMISAALGGTASMITGGNFANGAVTAAFVTLFNTVAHSSKSLPQNEDKMDSNEQVRKVHIRNNSDNKVFFKPEGDVDVDGVKYDNDGAYSIEPGESSYVPIDGIKINGDVYKISEGYNFIIINADGTYETNYTNVINWGYNALLGGYNAKSPDHTWDNLFNIK
jgi:hypothetical protein